MGLSRKPWGGFSWFFACKFVWMSQVLIAKIIVIGLISVDLEGFSITMATLLDFSKILFSPDVTGPALYTCVQFRSDPSRNHDGVRGRGHKPYCFYSMISGNKTAILYFKYIKVDIYCYHKVIRVWILPVWMSYSYQKWHQNPDAISKYGASMAKQYQKRKFMCFSVKLPLDHLNIYQGDSLQRAGISFLDTHP